MPTVLIRGKQSSYRGGLTLLEFVLNNIHSVPNLLIIQFDAEKRYVWFTKQLEEMLKVPPEKIQGKTPNDFFPQTILKDFNLHWDLVIQKKKYCAFEVIIPNPYAPFKPTDPADQQWTISLTPHFKDTGEIFRVTFIGNNTTEIWMMNQERHRMLIEREFFFRIASHDLKTPLTSLKSCVEMIQRDHVNASRLTPIMNNSIAKMESLIRDYLDWGKIISGKLQLDCNIHSTHELVNDVFQMISPQAQIRSIELVSEIHTDLFYGDRTRVTQVLTNLISNALKYGINEQGRKEIRITVNQTESNETIFCVVDYGRGISKEIQARVFDPYMQCDHSTEGVGLGLAICKSLITFHGGHLSVGSEPNQGSHFCFTLPNKR